MKKRNSNVDLLQIICTVMVVVIHVGSLTPDPVAHFIIKTMICRIAVPIFFVTSAFFYQSKSQSPEWRKKWRHNFIKQYLFLSVIYLPFGINFISTQIEFKLWYFPLFVLIGLLYSGIFYHLWYFPALLFSLGTAKKMVNKLGYTKSFGICFILYLIGSGETYYPYLKNLPIGTLYTQYFSIFVTTKNGLFYGLIFVLIGFYLRDKFKTGSWVYSHKISLLIASIGLLLVEGHVIFLNQGLDKNFLFSLIPLTIAVFACVVSKKQLSINFSKFRRYAQIIYFYHMIPIELFNNFILEGSSINLEAHTIGAIRLFLGICLPLFGIALYYEGKATLAKLPTYSATKKYLSLKSGNLTRYSE